MTPGQKAGCRIACSSSGDHWALSRVFGCQQQLFNKESHLSLDPVLGAASHNELFFVELVFDDLSGGTAEPQIQQGASGQQYKGSYTDEQHGKVLRSFQSGCMHRSPHWRYSKRLDPPDDLHSAIVMGSGMEAYREKIQQGVCHRREPRNSVYRDLNYNFFYYCGIERQCF